MKYVVLIILSIGNTVSADEIKFGKRSICRQVLSEVFTAMVIEGWERVEGTRIHLRREEESVILSCVKDKYQPVAMRSTWPQT